MRFLRPLSFFVFLFFPKNIHVSLEVSKSISFMQQQFRDGRFFELLPYDFKKDLLCFSGPKGQNTLASVNKHLRNEVIEHQKKAFLKQIEDDPICLIDFRLIPIGVLKGREFREKIRTKCNVFFEYDCKIDNKLIKNMRYFSVVKQLVIKNAPIKELSSQALDAILDEIVSKEKYRKNIQEIILESASKLKTIGKEFFNYKIFINNAPQLTLENNDLYNVTGDIFLNIKQLSYFAFEQNQKRFIKNDEVTEDDRLYLRMLCARYANHLETLGIEDAWGYAIIDELKKNNWFYTLFSSDQDFLEFFETETNKQLLFIKDFLFCFCGLGSILSILYLLRTDVEIEDDLITFFEPYALSVKSIIQKIRSPFSIFLKSILRSKNNKIYKRLSAKNGKYIAKNTSDATM